MIAGHEVGELQRGERLEQREQRAAKQSGLLAGDDGDGARIGELPRGLDGPGRRLAAPLLLRDDLRDLRVRPRDACGFVRRHRPTRRASTDRRNRTARPTKSRTRSRRRAVSPTESGGHQPESLRVSLTSLVSLASMTSLKN